MSLGAVLCVIYGLKRMAEDGLTPLTPIAVLAGIAIGVAFVRRQKRLADPLIDVRLFRLPAFSASLVAYMMGVFGAFGTFLFTAQYLQLVLGMSPLVAGLWSLPSSFVFIVSSMLAPLLVRRVRHAYAMTGGLLVAALGMLLLAQIDTGGVSMYVIASCVMSVGFAPVVTLTTDVIVGSAPPEKAGAASAISETSAEFGGALGIAILGSLGTAVYRASMAERIPADLSLELAEDARATLGGAVAAAGDAPAGTRLDLLMDAREAFTDALQAISLIGSVTMLLTAALVFMLLRDARPATH
jgi:DHA2 family multidrug resistance protein-like MFS transporter